MQLLKSCSMSVQSFLPLASLCGEDLSGIHHAASERWRACSETVWICLEDRAVAGEVRHHSMSTMRSEQNACNEADSESSLSLFLIHLLGGLFHLASLNAG